MVKRTYNILLNNHIVSKANGNGERSILLVSDIELMKRHVNVLFKKDHNNRMTFVNEPPNEAAPRIFIGGTQLGNVVRYSNALEENVIKKLERSIHADFAIDLAEIITILNTDRQISNFWTGPAFVFPDVSSITTKAIRITDFNKDCLKQNFPYIYEELKYKQPCFAIIEDEAAVSVCCSVRQTNEAAEASLATFETYRGRAYAIDASIAWAAEIQSQGLLALYSTSWDNFASQSVARKLHLIQYGTDIHMK
ncbi:GNAT family N-acetyltransferase [Oceanobacillus oncorhynchi subsp. oncorhynchi]|uniref:GNAT family N-acetyltransferase n=1 Tax=Oceanobacillus TaxID=182709 RepID=UPI0030DAD9D2